MSLVRVSTLGWLGWLDFSRMLGGIWKKLQMTPCTLPDQSYLTKTAVKSTSGLAPIEVLHLGMASLAGLQPDVRRDLEKAANNSLHPPKQIVFFKYCCKVNPWNCPC